jgi:hypothetical protein
MNIKPHLYATALAAVLALIAWPAGKFAAAEKTAVNPAGTWKITTFLPQTKRKTGSEQTLKLKLEGGKLTGTITCRSSVNGNVRIFEWPIADARLQGTDLSFSVTHPPVTGSGPDATAKYTGKISGDTMQGKAESEWSGHTWTRDWEAKRVKQ